MLIFKCGPRLKLKLSVSSVLAFDKFVDKIKVIGPRGESQFAATPVEDLSLLLSLKCYRSLRPTHFRNLKIH